MAKVIVPSEIKKEFFSFVAGRGWKGHDTASAAEKRACKEAKHAQKMHGGGLPLHNWGVTATGELL